MLDGARCASSRARRVSVDQDAELARSFAATSASRSTSTPSPRSPPPSRCWRGRPAARLPAAARPDPFETLVTSITAQQISLRAAFSIRNRLIESFGERHEVAYAVPDPGAAGGAARELVAVGFSRRKAEYVIRLARGELDLDGLALLPDEEVKSGSSRCPGSATGQPTGSSPATSAGRRLACRRPRAAQGRGHFYGDDADVRAAVRAFSPFANLAAHYLLVGHRVHG